MGSLSAINFCRVGFDTSSVSPWKAPFVFSQTKADGCNPADEGSCCRKAADQTSDEPPLRVAIARAAVARSDAATRWPWSYVQVTDNGDAPVCKVVQPRPSTDSCTLVIRV